jgi:soluble lytic murein transglycosylase-like protein
VRGGFGRHACRLPRKGRKAGAAQQGKLVMTHVTTPRRRRPALAAVLALLALSFSAASPGAQAQTLLQAWQNAALPAEVSAGAPLSGQALPAALPVNPQASAEAEKGALARFICAEYKTSTSLAARIVNAAYEAASRYQLSPSLVLAIISRESTFNPRATSGYGAQGLMQVVPRFHMDKVQEARATTAEASLFHPETNIAVGTRILAEYIDAESSLPRALLKYSGKAYRYIEKVMRERDAFERVRQEADNA